MPREHDRRESLEEVRINGVARVTLGVVLTLADATLRTPVMAAKIVRGVAQALTGRRDISEYPTGGGKFEKDP